MHESEILRVFGRVGNGCLSCTHWRADSVKARIGAHLIACWDHQPGQPTPKPPTLEELSQYCCKREWTEHDENFVGSFTKADW
jgi:hypothetical protein